MKKTLLIITSTLLLILGLIYTLLFTQTGNNLLRPVIESKLNQYSSMPLELETFSLSTNSIKLILRLDRKNDVSLEGAYSLFTLDFDIDYAINLTDLSALSEHIQRRLAGQLLSEGKIQGNLDLFKIKGKSNLAQSDGQYALVIKEMELEKAAIKLENINIQTLLGMLGEKAYSSGKIDVLVQLNDLDPTAMQGSVAINIKEAKLNARTLHKEFGLTLSRTSLKGALKATLDGTNINYLTNIDSALATLYSKGKIETDKHSLNASYKIDIKELALLRSITKAPLRGPFFTQGRIQGKDKALTVTGSSDIAGSDTSYKVRLADLKPTTLTFKSKHASLEKLLYLAGEPSYADGKTDLHAEFSSITPMKGDVTLSIGKGIAHTKEIQKAFGLNLPYTSFDLTSTATIQNDRLQAKTNLRSNLATVRMNKTEYHLKNTTLLSDYDLFIPSLQKLERLLDKKLFGEVKAKGEIKKDKQLTLSAHSDIFNGKLDAQVVDEKIRASFTGIHAIEVLQMLGYPKVMDAPINGTLRYNTSTRQGKLESRFDKAVLMRSKMTDLISGLSRTDLTKERFNEGSLLSIIDKDIIRSDLDMHSKRVNLKSKKFIIDSKKQRIDANFALQIKKYKADILVTENINSPKVRLDAKSMITPEIEEKVGKEINRFLKRLF